MSRPKTIFCDIDGTLWDHVGDITSQVNVESHKMLENTSEALNRWDKLGYRIILTTGRRESMRTLTENHLKKIGIVYDQLIMGLGGGARVLINDRKPNSVKNTAFAINLIRNDGLNFFDFSSDFCVLPNLSMEKIFTEKGYKEIIEYNDNYIVSKVEIYPNNMEEINEYHKLQKKTICVFEGVLFISLDKSFKEWEKLEIGMTKTLLPQQNFYLKSLTGCMYFETSTPEIWE